MIQRATRRISNILNTRTITTSTTTSSTSSLPKRHTFRAASRTPPTPCTFTPIFPQTQPPSSRQFHSTITTNSEPPTAVSDLDINQYHAFADETLDRIVERLEDIIDDSIGAEASNGFSVADVEYASGVLTLKFGPQHGTYVLNKQPPNKQIWLSSPTSGPKRFDYDLGKCCWVGSRDGVKLEAFLEGELKVIRGGEVVLE